MIELLLFLSLSGTRLDAGTQVADFEPCVMPNRCSRPAVWLAGFEPCVMPKKCGRSGFEEIL